VVVDETAVLPGRGAWLHPRIECLDKAQQRRAFGRAFRVKTALDTSSVRDFFERQATHPSIRTHSVSTEQAETYIVTN
jgi:predicted RNA-binding protein YlxR (DUF448 family)